MYCKACGVSLYVCRTKSYFNEETKYMSRGDEDLCGTCLKEAFVCYEDSFEDGCDREKALEHYCKKPHDMGLDEYEIMRNIIDNGKVDVEEIY